MAHDIPAPMLAKAVASIPDPSATPGGFSYEPKWDGFRVLASFDGESIELGSRGAKPLTRYFPELVAALKDQLTTPCLIDGEIAVAREIDGTRRLDWEALSARIHPAQSRVSLLAQQTPAILIAFDLLSEGGEDLTNQPFETRRQRLEELCRPLHDPLFLTRTTRDPHQAQDWLDRFEGAGLDGVIAKRLDAPYEPGKRTMLKIKHARTADVVLLGYRIHSSGAGVGSLLVGLYDDNDRLHSVGGIAAFTTKRRLALIDELADLVLRDDDGEPLTIDKQRSRFSGGTDKRVIALRPERVIEVRYDQLEGDRFRHTVQFERWRNDRDPHSCTFAQLETVPTYDLADVLNAD